MTNFSIYSCCYTVPCAPRLLQACVMTSNHSQKSPSHFQYYTLKYLFIKHDLCYTDKYCHCSIKYCIKLCLSRLCWVLTINAGVPGFVLSVGSIISNSLFYLQYSGLLGCVFGLPFGCNFAQKEIILNLYLASNGHQDSAQSQQIQINLKKAPDRWRFLPDFILKQSFIFSTVVPT